MRNRAESWSPKFLTKFYKSGLPSTMWQSLVAIGQTTSEIRRRKKRKKEDRNISSKTMACPRYRKGSLKKVIAETDKFRIERFCMLLRGNPVPIVCSGVPLSARNSSAIPRRQSPSIYRHCRPSPSPVVRHKHAGRRADEPFNSWRPRISNGCVASMERSWTAASLTSFRQQLETILFRNSFY